MTCYVVDTSVAVKWFVPEEDEARALSLLDPEHELHAPDLLAPEFGNTVWKKLRRGELTLDEARTVVNALAVVPLWNHSSSVLLPAAFDIAAETSRTVYDCLYVSLAVALGTRLVTADGRFVKALSETSFSSTVMHVREL